MLRRYAVRVPSVYVAGISAIAAPILVLESTGVARALGGSVRRLFRSSGLIFVVVLLLTAPLHASHYALDSAVQWLPEPGFDRMLRSSFRPVREVVTILLSSVSQLLSATLSALLYVKRPPRSESWS
jgi:hypothetical protein